VAPTARNFYWIESGRAGLVTLSLGGPERSRKNEYSGGRLQYLAKRFRVGPPRPKFYATLGYIDSQTGAAMRMQKEGVSNTIIEKILKLAFSALH